MVDEFPKPTPATVRELYGTAFRCAHPDCLRPLYRVSDDTGERILNSRVAHIHARRVGGPRWKIMDPEENRSTGNLLLLCIEHSYEIDDKALEDRYPADVLFEWKRRQLDEYDEIHRSWPLNEAEVREIDAASFDPVAAEHASSIAEAARNVAMLISAARRGRNGPLRQVGLWGQTYERIRNSVLAWNSEGERAYVEPSRAETEAHRTAVRAALAEAHEALVPLADAVLADLSAARASRDEITPWCEWVSRATTALLESTATWPAPPPFDDDESLEHSIAELQRALDGLTAKWRGEEVAEPPIAAVTREAVSPAYEEFESHRELLERARPFARVFHRPFDADLEEGLRQATAFAATLPTLASTLAYDLESTAGLAAAVARNADDATFRELIDDCCNRQPLAAGVLLARELMLLARGADRAQRAEEAENVARALLFKADWADTSTWRENDPYCALLLGFQESVIGADATRRALEEALEANPTVLRDLLRGCAEWIERRDSDTMSVVTGFHRRYSRLGAWFPSEAVVTAIQGQLPEVTAADEWNTERQGDEPRQLAAQVLRIALPPPGLQL
jgi:hypothetical protein